MTRKVGLEEATLIKMTEMMADPEEWEHKSWDCPSDGDLGDGL